MKKVITLLLSIVLVFGAMVPAAVAAADVGIVQPRYVRIGTIDMQFNIDSSMKATCYCSVESNYSTDTVDLTMELQRKVGEDWNTIKTWTASGTRYATLDKNWYVTSGYEYQIKITADVYNAKGTLMETQVDYAS